MAKNGIYGTSTPRRLRLPYPAGIVTRVFRRTSQGANAGFSHSSKVSVSANDTKREKEARL